MIENIASPITRLPQTVLAQGTPTYGLIILKLGTSS